MKDGIFTNDRKTTLVKVYKKKLEKLISVTCLGFIFSVFILASLQSLLIETTTIYLRLCVHEPLFIYLYTLPHRCSHHKSIIRS